MTALTADPRTSGAGRRTVPDAGGLTFGRVVAAEWVKFRTLRSTWWTLGVTVALMVGIAVLAAWGMTSEGGATGGSAVGAPIRHAGDVFGLFNLDLASGEAKKIIRRLMVNPDEVALKTDTT